MCFQVIRLPWLPLGCKGTVKTSFVVDYPQTGMTHNHDSNAATAEATKAKVNMKKLAMATRESSANLVARTLTSILEDARVEFPQESSAKKTIRRVRAGQRPPVPDSLQDLLIDGAKKIGLPQAATTLSAS